jgi:nicotinate-nucleotide adenylyltransferase
VEGLSEKLGIFGGTFDPPHLGHLILAEEARFQLELARVLWVLTPEPPHKAGWEILPWQVRMDLVRAAIEGEPCFELSTVDIDRPPPHYAFETLALIQDAHPDAELIYLMGGDSLHDLPSWRHPQIFLANCHAVGVMRRPGDEIDYSTLEAALPGVIKKVLFVDAPLLEISGSEIRRRAAEDEPIRYYLPTGVYELILERKLYRGDD